MRCIVDITRGMYGAVVGAPEGVEAQPDGRTRYLDRPGGRGTYSRVVVTADGTTLHNAFFDLNYTRKQRRKR